ncbi:tetraspanin-9-like [Xenia sp. Carnegie-2017]|uniref:tetraspanin-9-like n=1 Tax=Xenia sp. Carnegie-2017 TaxID=2897299 RepID=UPI001F0346F4|nr:tetraspanin-9-like [Xenia sp. Carnegie-2017]
MCGYTCIRYLVFFFNFIFFLSGAGLIVIGAYLKLEDADYLDLCDKYSWDTGSNLLLALGAVVFIIAFFGCYGALKKNPCFLRIYFVLLLIVSACEFAVAYLFGVERSKKVKKDLKQCFNETFVVSIKGSTKFQEHWNKFEEKYKCCGINGATDYGNVNVPCINATYSSTGCYDKIKTDLKDNLKILIIIGGSFFSIQILGLGLTIVLICKTKIGRKKHGEIIDTPKTTTVNFENKVSIFSSR